MCTVQYYEYSRTVVPVGSYVCYQGLITLEEGTITEGLIWFRVESYHVVAADGKIFWLSAAPT